jgi:hypothetical protein
VLNAVHQDERLFQLLNPLLGRDIGVDPTATLVANSFPGGLTSRSGA